MKEWLFSLAKQLPWFNLCSMIRLMLTVGNEISNTNISICLLSISICLVVNDIHEKTNQKIYSQNC